MTVRQILMWLSNKDDTIDYDSVEKDIRKAVVREESVGTWLIGDGDGIPPGYYDLIPKETP